MEIKALGKDSFRILTKKGICYVFGDQMVYHPDPDTSLESLGLTKEQIDMIMDMSA